MPNQITSKLLMVRPANFGFNPETASNNVFQIDDKSRSTTTIKAKAVQEFDLFVKKLRAAAIEVFTIADTAHPVKTDSVFPNNWISFHEDGLIVTYPMYSPNRRLECRQDIIDQLSDTFVINNHIRLEKWEQSAQYLEGTGSIILDRPNQIAYASLSIRTNLELFNQFCQAMDYQKIVFNSVDKTGKAIYHTNVMMAIGTSFVIICMDSIRSAAERDQLSQSFETSNKEVILITLDQMYAFAGNMLQVKNKEGNTYLVMSSQAYHSLTDEQVQQIEKHTTILHSDLSTIETYGGGSARCMLAEIFLEKKYK